MNNAETNYEKSASGSTNLQATISPKHRSFGDLIRLAPDVALVFPTSEAVNEALRYLIEMAKRPSLLS
ncbi:hypothetical protein [Crenothrix sp.]|uniref:hypothetical protein n=1 Tax=Crenothrix sp. TaxID=3100433 RepID=UPI00374D3412